MVMQNLGATGTRMQTKIKFSAYSCLPTASGCLFFLEAETSERLRFLAALSQGNQLDHDSTYNGFGV
jgi:hypothetical protein